MNRILTSIIGLYNTGLLVIVVALSSGTGLSWSCDWDSQVLKVIVDKFVGDQLLGH